jgi:hypothetical protein
VPGSKRYKIQVRKARRIDDDYLPAADRGRSKSHENNSRQAFANAFSFEGLVLKKGSENYRDKSSPSFTLVAVSSEDRVSMASNNSMNAKPAPQLKKPFNGQIATLALIASLRYDCLVRDLPSQNFLLCQMSIGLGALVVRVKQTRDFHCSLL